jgi:hypothetical protein
MTDDAPSQTAGPLRTTRPRLTGGISLVLATLTGAVGGLWLWSSGVDEALRAPAIAQIALALVALAIGGLAFAVAASPTPSRFVTVLRMATGLAFGLGLGSLVAGVVLGVTAGSVMAFFAGFLGAVLALIITLQGALVRGAAAHRRA